MNSSKRLILCGIIWPWILLKDPRPSREMMGTMTDDVDDVGVGFECMDPGMV